MPDGRYLVDYFTDPQSAARGVAATWILTGALKPVVSDAMDVDEEEGKGKQRATETQANVRGCLIVFDADRQGMFPVLITLVHNASADVTWSGRQSCQSDSFRLQ